MQFSTIVLSGFLGLAAAASSTNVTSIASQLPSCSLQCLAEGASSADCGSTDYSCQCEHQAAIASNSSSCISSSCSVSNITTTQKVITEICDAVNGSSTTSSSSSASSSTASSTSSSSSSTGTSGSSAGSHIELAGLGWAAIVGVAGFLAM